MEIVKRGKVAYLFERYTEELQIQTLLLLSRGGNLEVTAQMKYHVDKWGKARYGEKTWPHKVRDEMPALFIGMTGIDEEFRNREEYADKVLYEQPAGPVDRRAGQRDERFRRPRTSPSPTSIPIRYPGTWDTDERAAAARIAEKWIRARKAFLESETGEELRPLARAPLGRGHARRRRRTVADLRRHPRRDHRRRQAEPAPERDRRGPEPPARSSPAAGSSIPTRTSTARSGSRAGRQGARLAAGRPRAGGLLPRPRPAGIAWPFTRATSWSWPIAPRSPAGGTATRCRATLRGFLHDWATVAVGQAMGGVHGRARGRRPLAGRQRRERPGPLPVATTCCATRSSRTSSSGWARW